MTSEKKIVKLKKKIKRLAARPDRRFFYKYIPVASNGVNDRPNTLEEKLRQFFPFSVPLYYMWKWEPGLNYASRDGQPVICMALNMEKEKFRAAALRLDNIFKSMNLVPVALTDLQDFSFLVRLGWQLEFLPKLESRDAYARKKLRYLALRYQGAYFIPMEIGLENDDEIRKLLDGLTRPIQEK